MSRKRLLVSTLLAAVCIAGGVLQVQAAGAAKADEKQTSAETDDGKFTKAQKKTLQRVEEIYDTEHQQKVAEELEEKKNSQKYTMNNMLIEQNPYGTNAQSLYVYFHTDELVKVSYTVHTKNSEISDFKKDVYQQKEYETEHEFQVIGLVPEMENKVTFFMTRKDGATDKKEIVFEMGSVLGPEEIRLDLEQGKSGKSLEDGLYTLFSRDVDTGLGFLCCYDNEGVLRGEIPLFHSGSSRLLFDESSVYYNISETQIGQMNRLGQITQIYDLGNYALHHDYTFDENGNMLILASDQSQNRMKDVLIKLDTVSGEVSEVLDLGDLLPEYQALCKENPDGKLDWMHLNSIQWIGDGSVLLSSRETSSIIKLRDIYHQPTVAYIIGEPAVWDGTEYENLVLKKEGEFAIQGGQCAVSYLEDEELEDGQYYLYMRNNNIGESESRPDLDWNALGFTKENEKTADYYRYLVDENTGTFGLVDSFELPYSGYGGSVQEIGDSTVCGYGLQGGFGEYDENHELIASYEIDTEDCVHGVYKYDFKSFYFASSGTLRTGKYPLQ